MLNTDIDTIDEQNKNIAHEIQKHERRGEESEADRQARIQALKEEIEAA